ncbi:hypothetical protein [Bacillus sp. SJS]|uniref:hypothetical protein n=1 Tax=Bacillus sp. SJS TaxID=1423321 RepID=UPI0004DD04F0|nr:hypothetical protein [Bacillus sp. SJS]KZZ85647.1 hypothetical protein AS29_003400 [Bacillus sp. SJS]
MVLSGDTVRLKVEFKSFSGNLVDPENVELCIYDMTGLHLETIPIADSNREKVGVYFYDYETTASGLNESFVFEFAGSYNNKPILARGKVKVQFSK